MSDFTIEQVIEKYLDLREQIDLINNETKTKLEPLNAAMKGIESYLMAVANQTGQTQFGTTHGTAFMTTQNQCGVDDFEATKKFMIRDAVAQVAYTLAGDYTPSEDDINRYVDLAMQHCKWHLLNKAVNKIAVGEYIETEGKPPPGVKWTTMKVIQVRKKTSGKNVKEIEE